MLGVDTVVRLRRRRPRQAGRRRRGARRCSRRLAGRTHEVVSGLCLRTHEWEELHREVTHVTFRPLAAREIERYVARASGRDEPGAYAIQGLGASLVERIDGDYLNVVGLPAALLVRVLAERFPGTYGFG